ncbi:hypothetical protein HETIRDRAFT_442717 [Heterobasidion irregulare TC 32-1]|uniref:Uncharacterized protein n=1 Tax=Heterobasidion irregulare (strain TC 32-1) TaxID=747525 RepID=W4JMQ0_HETIT|nr:uncharacterized protein HETIRDRAFT_442717 [Heterobasidion irregulare TC 32-1]ETW74793.1 hypothetical protein HETIRDRAFT_442717 [Heterobasidion irregulare TC 32-1]
MLPHALAPAAPLPLSPAPPPAPAPRPARAGVCVREHAHVPRARVSHDDCAPRGLGALLSDPGQPRLELRCARERGVRPGVEEDREQAGRRRAVAVAARVNGTARADLSPPAFLSPRARCVDFGSARLGALRRHRAPSFPSVTLLLASPPSRRRSCPPIAHICSSSHLISTLIFMLLHRAVARHPPSLLSFTRHALLRPRDDPHDLSRPAIPRLRLLYLI